MPSKYDWMCECTWWYLWMWFSSPVVESISCAYFFYYHYGVCNIISSALSSTWILVMNCLQAHMFVRQRGSEFNAWQIAILSGKLCTMLSFFSLCCRCIRSVALYISQLKHTQSGSICFDTLCFGILYDMGKMFCRFVMYHVSVSRRLWATYKQCLPLFHYVQNCEFSLFNFHIELKLHDKHETHICISDFIFQLIWSYCIYLWKAIE